MKADGVQGRHPPGNDVREAGGDRPDPDTRSRAARLSPAKRALLEERRRAPSGAVGITRRPPDEPLVLSWAQERVWFLEQFSESRSGYNAPRAVRLRGPLDTDALQAALDGIVARHHVLRTTLTPDDGLPVLRLLEGVGCPMRHVDLSGRTGDSRDELQLLLREEVSRPFDLSCDVLLRGLLIRLADDEHVLAVVSHHIASDEPSKRLVAAELQELYAAHRGRRPSPLAPLALQYSDYAAWQRREGVDYVDSELSYWRTRLDGAPAMLDLPTDRPRPPMETHQGAKLRTVLPASLSEAVRDIGKGQQASVFMTLLAGFAAVLEHWSGQDDMVVGTPITGRTHAELTPLIGFFSNTLALRLSASGDPTFAELVVRVRQVCLGAYANQNLPFERLVQELRPERDLSRNPIFQVMFTLRPGAVSLLHLDDLESEGVAFDSGSSKFDLSVIAIDDPDGITVVWEYNTDLFDVATIERLAGRYERLFEAVSAQPGKRLSELDLLTPEETAEIVAGNATEVPGRSDVCLHTLVAERAASAPGAPAVRGVDSQLSYEELWTASQRLARHLRARGVRPGTLVGVWAQRSPELLVAIVGILAAGGAYVPLEPTYPSDRLAFTVADAGVDLVVVPSGSTAEAALLGPEVLSVDDPCLDEPVPADMTGVCPDVVPTDLAYVIYTSGSTGRPKGVMVEHAGVVNLMTAMAAEPGLKAGEVMVGLTTPAFDLSVPDLFLPLVCGATLVLADQETAVDPAALADLIDRQEADLVQATPSTWAMLCESGWQGSPGLRAVCGGERFSAELVVDLTARGVTVWNFYGPTEATVWATARHLGAGTSDPVPMGRPLANVRCHVLDRHGRSVPVGTTGELHLSGAGLARGYHNRPELTAESFVSGPAAPRGEARAYRTGDLVRRRADGDLVFVRRRDDQVKLRGYRIELGEIETALAEHPDIARAAATVRDDTPRGACLVAYVVAVAGALAPSGPVLRALLARRLPSYMVPSDIVSLDELPLTPTGKVDRAALPAPGDAPREAGSTDSGGASDGGPRNPAEEVLASIWTRLLGVDHVGMSDNFFDLGGHSMLAARMVARVEKAFKRKLPLAIVMQAGTIERMAELLTDDGGRQLWKCVVPIKQGTSMVPLFCVHGMAGVVTGYRHLFPHLAADQRVYGIQAPGLDGEELPLRRVEDLADRYISEIRAIQPEGPYLLAGVCFGGMVVFEMAHRLSTRMGADVGLVALIDPPVLRSSLLQVRRRVAKFRRVAHGGRAAFLRETLAIFSSLANRAAWDLVTQHRAGHRPLPRRPHAMEAVNRRAAFLYEPPVYTGRVVLYRSDGLKALAGEGHSLAWSTLVGDHIEVLDVPGTSHRTLFREPHVREVAVHLQRSIDSVLDRHHDETPPVAGSSRR